MFGLRRDVEGEFARAVQTDGAFPPLAPDADELANRKSVQELIGDHDRRTVGDVFQARRPGHANPAVEKKLVLHFGERRAHLHEPDVERGAELRHDARGAERVAHQRSASRSAFDEAHARRRSHAGPDLGRPEADQLAEHLGDFGRRGEVAGRAERIAVHVIAELGMSERDLHVLLDRDRAVLADRRFDLV